jgi:hypothetical protein
MVETEEQRRWWFATHPEYSWSSKSRGRKENDKVGVNPKDVDDYADKALQHLSGPVADLLKSMKKHFGSEGDAMEAPRAGDDSNLRQRFAADFDPAEWRNADYHYKNGRKAARDAIRLMIEEGTPVERPGPHDKSDFARGFRDQFNEIMAQAQKNKSLQNAKDWLLGGAKKTESGEKTPYEIAKEGGRHSGQLRRFEQWNDKQLEKSIRSFDKNIAEHEGYLSNPKSKAPEWDRFPPDHQERLKKVWERHLQNTKELKDVAQQVLKQRKQR